MSMSVGAMGGGVASWRIGGRDSFVRVGDHVLPREVLVELAVDSTHDSPLLHLEIAVEDGRPLCRSARIVGGEARREVRSSDFARIRVEQLIEDVLALFALTTSMTEGGALRMTPVGQPIDALPAVHGARRARKLTPAFLREVAAVYLSNRSSAPTTAVAERYGVAHRTASYWAAKAEEAGYLRATTRGRKRR
jgi:hypothetical protein